MIRDLMFIKKKVCIILIIFLTAVLVDVFVLKYIFVSKEITNRENIPFLNSCNSDTECVLATLDSQCEKVCPPGLVDYGQKKYVSVNLGMYRDYGRNWFKENCHNVSLWGLSCPEALSVYKNTHFKALCVDHRCAKVRKSLFSRFFGK